LLALVSALGLGGYGGLRFCAPQFLLVFLVLGLGVDYSIILVRAVDAVDMRYPLPYRVGTGIREVGVALFLSTLTTMISLLTVASIEIPLVQDMCSFAALGVMSLFFQALSTFLAVLVFDEQRRATGLLIDCWLPGCRVARVRSAPTVGELGELECAAPATGISVMRQRGVLRQVRMWQVRVAGRLASLMGQSSLFRLAVMGLWVASLVGAWHKSKELEIDLSVKELAPKDSAILEFDAVNQDYWQGVMAPLSLVLQADRLPPLQVREVLSAAVQELLGIDMIFGPSKSWTDAVEAVNRSKVFVATEDPMDSLRQLVQVAQADFCEAKGELVTLSVETASSSGVASLLQQAEGYSAAAFVVSEGTGGTVVLTWKQAGVVQELATLSAGAQVIVAERTVVGAASAQEVQALSLPEGDGPVQLQWRENLSPAAAEEAEQVCEKVLPNVAFSVGGTSAPVAYLRQTLFSTNLLEGTKRAVPIWQECHAVVSRLNERLVELQYPYHAFVTAEWFGTAERDSNAKDMLTRLAVVVSAVIGCCTAIVVNPVVGVVVVGLLLAINASIAGCLAVAGLRLSVITIVCFALTVGMAVDYLVSICYSLAHGPAEKLQLRFALAIQNSVVPLSEAALSFFVGVVMLAFADSVAFRTFFQVCCMMLGLYMAYSFILAPVTLRVIFGFRSGEKSRGLFDLPSHRDSEEDSEVFQRVDHPDRLAEGGSENSNDMVCVDASSQSPVPRQSLRSV